MDHMALRRGEIVRCVATKLDITSLSSQKRLQREIETIPARKYFVHVSGRSPCGSADRNTKKAVPILGTGVIARLDLRASHPCRQSLCLGRLR